MALSIGSFSLSDKQEPTKDCAVVPFTCHNRSPLRRRSPASAYTDPSSALACGRFDSSVRCWIWLETLSHLACASFEASLRIKAHAHMLRHVCGVKLERTASTRGRCRRTSGTAISRTRRVTRRWRRTAVKGFWRDYLANGVCFDRKPKTISGGEQSAAVVRASQSRE